MPSRDYWLWLLIHSVGNAVEVVAERTHHIFGRTRRMANTTVNLDLVVAVGEPVHDKRHEFHLFGELNFDHNT